MAINLGFVNQESEISDDSFNEMYIDFLETNQQLVNLENATEIAEKAQATGSMEVIQFAEELLGCSLEVLKDKEKEKIRIMKNIQYKNPSAKVVWFLARKAVRILMPMRLYSNRSDMPPIVKEYEQKLRSTTIDLPGGNKVTKNVSISAILDMISEMPSKWAGDLENGPWESKFKKYFSPSGRTEMASIFRIFRKAVSLGEQLYNEYKPKFPSKKQR